jgi:hypothetical protein
VWECWKFHNMVCPAPLRDALPAGFVEGAGAVEIAVAVGALLQGADVDPVSQALGAGPVFATLAAAGDALGFWPGGADGDGGPRVTAALADLVLAQDLPWLEALHRLDQAGKLRYTARVSAGSTLARSHASGNSGSAPDAEQRCNVSDSDAVALSTERYRHAVTFTVHLSTIFFDKKKGSRDVDSVIWLRRLMSRFDAKLVLQGDVERREVESMRKAAQCLGLSPREDVMSAFLDLRMELPGAAQGGLEGKFRLEQVLKSILRPSVSVPKEEEATTVEEESSPPKAECHDPKGKRAMSPDRDVGPRQVIRAGAFQSLPQETLVQILEEVEPEELAVISRVCTALRAAARLCVPGLKLTLYNHQRSAMEWMIARERHSAPVWNPTLTRFKTCAGTEYFLANNPDGAALTWHANEPLEVDDVAGGLLCDEPGMGKTITVLAVILKTRSAARRRAAAADDDQPAHWLGESSGRRRRANQEHEDDELGPGDLPTGLLAKRFRFRMSGQDILTWAPTLAPAPAAQAAAAMTPQQPQRGLRVLSAAPAAASRSPALRSSARSGDSLLTPLVRRSRAAAAAQVCCFLVTCCRVSGFG